MDYNLLYHLLNKWMKQSESFIYVELVSDSV